MHITYYELFDLHKNNTLMCSKTDYNTNKYQ